MGVRPSESRYMFEILLRHPDFVAINKPAGLCVHQDGAAESFTGLLAQQLGVARVWLLHRLDKPTGGVLLLDKKGSLPRTACTKPIWPSAAKSPPKSRAG